MKIPESICSRAFEEYQNSARAIIAQMSVSAAERFASKIQELRDNFYLTYPFLFSSHYPLIPEEQVHQLTLTGNLYFTYLLLLDEFLDHDTDTHFLVALHRFHEKAVRQLCFLFPPDSCFWPIFEQYERTFFLAVGEEFGHVVPEEPQRSPSEQDLLAAARGKSAFAKAATAGLWVLAGCVTTQDPFVETQDSFHTALQLLDDLQDWRQDFQKHRSSYLLSTILSEPDLREALQQPGADQIQLLGRYIHFSGASEDLLHTAKLFFERALTACEPYDVPFWKSVVKSRLVKAGRLLEGLRDTKRWIIEKKEKVYAIHQDTQPRARVISAQLGNGTLDNSLAEALAYVLVEQEHGFPEMNHRMALPSFAPDPGELSEVDVYGNLFQRTTVLEALLDVQEMFPHIVSRDIFSQEVTEVVQSRVGWVRGGWNYFPGYRGLPPDTDDLAQVVRVLTRAQAQSCLELVDDAIDLLIASNRYPNGTFRTWILDPSDGSDAQVLLRQSVQTHWGEYFGKDIEVTANMLHALWIYDKEKYREVVRQGVEAVAAAQNASGMWRSVWYWNLFYGTFAAVRLFASTRLKLERLQSTAQYLVSAQHDDGGWGQQFSDPLNTAIALLTLMQLKECNVKVTDDVLDRAVSYLVREQQPGGSWRQVPFTKMFVGNRDITYQSRTITTSFTLRALLRFSANQHLSGRSEIHDHSKIVFERIG